jgi:MFS family permease
MARRPGATPAPRPRGGGAATGARHTAWPFALVGGAWFAVMTSSNLATPLYAVYERRFGFSSAVLTVVFATYALVLAPSLLVFGQLSDRLGRRRVMSAGLATAGAGAAVFAAARGLPWLFAARAVQGLAVGMISGAASAALVELDPGHPWPPAAGDEAAPRTPGAHHRPALVAALAQAGGSAAGPLVGGLLAAWLPAPRVLCFALLGAVMAACAAAMLTIPEPAPAASAEWRIQRPSVPVEIRGLFARVAVTGAVLWAVAALFLSVVPLYAARLLDTSSLALLGTISALMLGASCTAQLVSRGSQPAGLLLAVAGLGALRLAFPLHSLPMLLLAAVLAGSGHGLGFLRAQAELNAAAPAARRGEVNAAFYTCIYLGVGISVIATGLLTLGASLTTAVTAFAVVMGAIALATTAWHLSVSRRSRRSPEA